MLQLFLYDNLLIAFHCRNYVHTEDGREIPNVITCYLDASMIYGSDEVRSAFLRTFEGGKLTTSENDLLPFNDGTQENAGGNGTYLFVAGDVRANENVGLTSMHTLFVREHNYWDDKISKKIGNYKA